MTTCWGRFRMRHDTNERMASVHDMHLLHLIAPDGLATLLVPLVPGGRTGNREEGVVSPDEWGELVRSLHIPHYEETRQYYADAEAEGFFDGPARHAPYSHATLLDILNQDGHGADGDEHTNA